MAANYAGGMFMCATAENMRALMSSHVSVCVISGGFV